MNKNDYYLDSLPVPRLNDAIKNLEILIEPLVTEKEYDKTKEALQGFSKSGELLHKKLQEFSQEKFYNHSWLRPLWDDKYLSYRGSSLFNMCYWFLFNKQFSLSDFIEGLTVTINKLANKELEPETFKDKVFSMDMLNHMIYTRIPSLNSDLLFYPSLNELFTASVICRGNYYIISLMDKDGKIISSKEIKKILNKIRKNSKANDDSIGVMTAIDRDETLDLYNELTKDAYNRVQFEKLKNSLFTICLDDDYISTKIENRWYDKSLQIIAVSNDEYGVNIEHAGCDASIWIYLFNNVAKYLAKDRIENSSECISQPIDFKINNILKKKLNDSYNKCYAKIDEILYGQRKIKISKNKLKELEIRPDAFAQTLFQLTFYQLTNSFKSSYEAVSTRNFYQGRTEAVRPLSNEMKAFILSFQNDGVNIKEKFLLLQQVHNERIRIAQEALGVERYMAGLSYMSDFYNIKLPEIFNDKGFKKLIESTISTSSSTADFINYFGFNPVVHDGIGIGYGIKEETFNIYVSAYKNSGINPDIFLDAMQNNANKLIDALKKTNF